MDAEPLPGGRTTPGVVRVGDTVRRPRGQRAEAVAAILVALADLGFAWSPRHLGVDEEGRDVLAYEPGRTSDHPSQRDERCYAAVGRMLRDLHETTRGLPVAAGGACVVHGDPGPFNTVLRDGMPVLLIDWDGAHGGDPLEDVGYAAWTWCVQSSGGVPIADQAARLRRFRDGYDASLPPGALLGAVDERQRAVAAAERAVLGRTGTSAGRRAWAAEAVAWAEGDRALVRRHRDVFAAALERDPA